MAGNANAAIEDDLVYIGVEGAVSRFEENSGGDGMSYKLGGVGVLYDGEMAGMEVTVTGPGVLSFDWKVSSEAEWDWLSFYEVGSGATNQISGTGTGWAHVSVTVGGELDTNHTFRWEYEKDPVMEYVGKDCGWVDAITWSSLGNVLVTVNNGSGGGWYPVGSVVTVTADPAPPYMDFTCWTGDAAGQLDDPATSTAQLTVPGCPASLTATYTPTISRVAGCYGREFFESGTLGGISMDTEVGVALGNPAVKLGGAGVVPDNGFAAFETEVWGSGIISFWWKVVSESNADFLKFWGDGAEVAAISGTRGPWAQVTYSVEGINMHHTLKWQYVKDGSDASATDAGWVDEIVWTGDAPVAAITPNLVTAASEADAFTLSFLGERGIPYTVYSNACLTAKGWGAMDLVPAEIGEINGLFQFRVAIIPPLDLPSCFFRVSEPPPPPPLYMIIDLSGGSNASSYPVTYSDVIPGGSWTDEYKTTKLVMRKIPKGTFTMGSPSGELGYETWMTETQHSVTLTKDFYIGVFEVTQRQWELVMGNKPSYFNNSTYYMIRPVEQVSYYDIRENPANRDDPVVNWPANQVVNAASFMGKLRAKTGLGTFDLPTESQWEYACRAGTTTALNSGKNLKGTGSCPNMAAVGRCWNNGGSSYSQSGTTATGTAKAGSYLPNAWGLYDMHGNVFEWCLDWYGTYPGTVTDPKGAVSGSFRVLRGGSWNDNAQYCRSANRLDYYPYYQYSIVGFRAASTIAQ